jgi:hypothetical protein
MTPDKATAARRRYDQRQLRVAADRRHARGGTPLGVPGAVAGGRGDGPGGDGPSLSAALLSGEVVTTGRRPKVRDIGYQSVNSAACRSLSASAHRSSAVDADPRRIALSRHTPRGCLVLEPGTPAGRRKPLLRFGLGRPVFPYTRPTPVFRAGKARPAPVAVRAPDLVCAVQRPDSGHSTARRSRPPRGCARPGWGGGCGDRRAPPGRRLEARRLFEGTGNRLR